LKLKLEKSISKSIQNPIESDEDILITKVDGAKSTCRGLDANALLLLQNMLENGK